jgi:ABC-type transport system substrate-binding protein
VEKAQQLMKEAGYENGFECTMISPNNRYVNDEKIAEACASMLSKINIKDKFEDHAQSPVLGSVRRAGGGYPVDRMAPGHGRFCQLHRISATCAAIKKQVTRPV